jgi:hypothetical protein
MSEPITILLVGHCGPDSYGLKAAVTRFVPGARVEFINDQRTLEAKLGDAHLALVNRVLDGHFAAQDGTELIALLATGARAGFLLISNYPEAQAAAARAGALRGFGKAEMNSPAARECLLTALAARQPAS